MHISVISITPDNKLGKYQLFEDATEANEHAENHGGFATIAPEGNQEFWVVDPVAKTVSHDLDAENSRIDEISAPNSVITFDAFEERFTTQEWDDATDYVYEVDTTTGKPKRRALVQGLARAQARNSVDLEDDKTDIFLGVLVSGGVISATRKTQILTP